MYYRPGIGCVYLERDDKDGGLDTHPLHKKQESKLTDGLGCLEFICIITI